MTLKETPGSSYAYAYVNSEGNTSSRVLFSFTIQPPLKGDVSGDGELSLEDAILALKVTTGLSAGAISADKDVNADGRIGLPEALYVIQSLSGLR
jgi:hypothetical protein